MERESSFRRNVTNIPRVRPSQVLSQVARRAFARDEISQETKHSTEGTELLPFGTKIWRVKVVHVEA
jgi:hypothetical protein